jgi:hypothetical protein
MLLAFDDRQFVKHPLGGWKQTLNLRVLQCLLISSSLSSFWIDPEFYWYFFPFP